MDGEPTLGALVHDLSEQLSTLVREEMALAQAEMKQKGKRAGIGLGLFSASGLLTFFGVAVLITAGILALSLVLPAWASALFVGVGLLLLAGIAAQLGVSEVGRATPPKPEHALEGIKEDIATVKGEHSHAQ